MSRTAAFLLALVLAAAPAFAATDEVVRVETLLELGDPGAGDAVAALVKARPADTRVGVLQVRLLMQQRRIDQAVKAAEKLVAAAPDSGLAHLWLGMAYGSKIGSVNVFSQAGMASKIRAAFERAAELDPSLHQAHLALIEYYLQAPGIVGGSKRKAQAVAGELGKIDAAFGQYALARIAMADEDAATVRRHVLAAYTARPGEDTFRMAAGLMHQDAKEWDQAFAVFEAWTRDEPQTASAWYQVGRTAVLSESRLDDGIAAFRKVLDLYEQPGAPGHKYAWYRLGQALALKGDKAGARAAYNSALALDPELPEAKEALAKL